MSLKHGVDLRGLHPVWGIAYPIIKGVFQDHGYPCIITSANDSQHGPNSLHYKGKALDFRTKHIMVADKSGIVNDIRAALGDQFDLVFESVGLPQEHLHVEFDPKEPDASAI